MQEKTSAHITTGKAYLDTYAAKALMTTEEHRAAALLKKIEINFATLGENEKDKVKDNCYDFWFHRNILVRQEDLQLQGQVY